MSNTSATEVKSSPLGGKGLFATKIHSPGDVLLELERPLIAVLDSDRREDTCAWCFAGTGLPVLTGAGPNHATEVNWCTGCKHVKYCSKRCQARAWRQSHKWECKIFAKSETPIPDTVVAVMRMLRGFDASSDNSGPNDKLYQEIRHMQSHRDDFQKTSGTKWEAIRLMAHTVLTFLVDSESKLEVSRTAMCILMCNSSRFVAPTLDTLGLMLDPRTSTMNHSCTPNADIIFDGPKLSVRALERIPSGREITISYIDNSAPFGVRQAELRDQYFFTCNCPKCKLGFKAPQDAFLEPGPEFEERIKVIDDLVPEIVQDPAWPRHVLGQSAHEQRLSALQFYAYSFLDSPEEEETQDPTRYRKAITICRNTGIWPLTRGPLPGLYQQYAVACLSARRYNEALIARLRLHVLIDPIVYPQEHHPVRVVHAWALATLAKAIGSDQDLPFCKTLLRYGVDLSILFLALLMELREQVPKSHGAQSQFARMIEGTFQAMMEPGGELDSQYSQMGLKRDQWQHILEEQIEELWPRVQAFVEDDAITAMIDEALEG